MQILKLRKNSIFYQRVICLQFVHKACVYRERLAERYTNHSDKDCDLTNEWWDKFNALPPEKLERAKEIIALNKFKDGEYQCDDSEIEGVLWYYKTTRNDAEK